MSPAQTFMLTVLLLSSLTSSNLSSSLLLGWHLFYSKLLLVHGLVPFPNLTSKKLFICNLTALKLLILVSPQVKIRTLTCYPAIFTFLSLGRSLILDSLVLLSYTHSKSILPLCLKLGILRKPSLPLDQIRFLPMSYACLVHSTCCPGLKWSNCVPVFSLSMRRTRAGTYSSLHLRPCM